MNQRQQLIEQIRQQSIQRRAQALREAAQRQANNAPIANAAAGASSGGGGRRGCSESDGLTMTWVRREQVGPGEFIDFTQRVFLPYAGQDEEGNSVFQAITDQYQTGDDSGGISLELYRSGSQWLLELIFFSASRGGSSTIIAESTDLYEGWTGLASEEFDQPLLDITAACGDQRYTELCLTTTSASLPAFIQRSSGIEFFLASVSEEYPFAYGGFERGVISWNPVQNSWEYGRDSLGGTLAQPPTGEFGELTITAGSCADTPVPPTPEPNLVTTSDISVSTTQWNWSAFDGAGQASGSIAIFNIDGQSGSLTSAPLPPGTYTYNISPILDTPNTYLVRLASNASEQVVVQIGTNSYPVFDMFLTITTDGTDPISGSSTGVITAISGTITYVDEGGSTPAPPPK